MDINAAVGGKAGLSQEAIEAALGIKESSDLSERERIALEYADRVSATPVDVPEEFFDRRPRSPSAAWRTPLWKHFQFQQGPTFSQPELASRSCPPP
jgi:alkylhydroperoxidase family enzyme